MPNRCITLMLLLFSISTLLLAQETVITFKIAGKLSGRDFVATNFAEKGYQNSEGIQGELKETLPRPGQVEFFHIKGSGKILDRRAFWVGNGAYTITGSIDDLTSFKIDPEHEFNQILRQIEEAKGEAKKELILQNLDKEVGVLSFISNESLFSQEEISQAAQSMPSEMRELNSFKRFSADAKLPENSKFGKGSRGEDFSLESREGGQVALSDFSGKYRLLEFSFSGCKPCIEALPEIKEIHERFGEDLEVISIWNDHNKDVWLNSSKKYKDMIEWTDLWDESGYVTKLYQIDMWPSYMLINPGGEIEQIWRGYLKGRMMRKMSSLFGNPEP